MRWPHHHDQEREQDDPDDFSPRADPRCRLDAGAGCGSEPRRGRARGRGDLEHASRGAGTSEVDPLDGRSAEHTSELQSLMRISYAVFWLKKKKMLMKRLKTTKITL